MLPDFWTGFVLTWGHVYFAFGGVLLCLFTGLMVPELRVLQVLRLKFLAVVVVLLIFVLFWPILLPAIFGTFVGFVIFLVVMLVLAYFFVLPLVVRLFTRGKNHEREISISHQS